MINTLEDLAMEYERSVAVQKKVIESNRKKLMQARRKGSFTEIKRLTTLLQVLYEEKSELEEKANRLRNYYS